MSHGEATTRDYDLTCRHCHYNLRGLPPDPDSSRIRCPECGRETDDLILRERRAALAFRCVECDCDLRGLPRLIGTGVYICPTCGHRHPAFSGVFPNHRICDRDLRCGKCSGNLRGAAAPPGSELVCCPECGCWNSAIGVS